MNWPARLVVSLLVAFGTAVVAAVLLAVMDLYLTGHGYGSIREPALIQSEATGTHMSLADIVLAAASLTTGAVTWVLVGRRRS